MPLSLRGHLPSLAALAISTLVGKADDAAPPDPEPPPPLWSLAPISSPAPPGVALATWPTRDLDRFVLARIEAAGHRPTGAAAPRALARRAYLDLHGLPPTREQMEAFLVDNRPDAWARLIDELLASPRYGERWGRHWLDVARYADSNGMDEDIAHPSAWRYRDYVINAFNADKPFDRFIVEQLAGDLLPAADLAERRSQTIAAGFLSIGPKMLACDDPDKMRRDIVDEQIDTAGRAFLGMTFGCARCHDHKYDPVSIEDYYGLAGIFLSTQTLTKYSVVAKIHAHELSAPEVRAGRARIAEIDRRLAHQDTREEDKAPLIAEKEQLARGLPPEFDVIAPTEYPAEDARVHLRGDYQTLGDLVPRRFPVALAGNGQTAIPPGASGRLEFARWIASPDHPLTARVIANRVWRWHFGRGLVPTPDNFGALGTAPTHPALLDHLAGELVASGWSLKALHREIMLSATYRQSASAAGALLEADPDNALFARWQRRRMESEAVRDSILAKSGRLDLTPAGPSLGVRPNHYVDRDKLGEYARATCRTVYLPVLRSSGYDGQNAFDFPDPAVPDGDRRTSTVAPQALFLMNSDLVHASSQTLAEARLAAAPDEAPAARAAWMVEHLLDRPATAAEIERAQRFIAHYPADSAEAWAAFARALFASNEFLYIE